MFRLHFSFRLSSARILSLVLLSMSAFSCIKDTHSIEGGSLSETVPSPGHDAIVLGRMVSDPFSLENMQKAYNSLGLEGVLSPTHLYVRFMPSSPSDLSGINSLGVPLFDHPLDRIIETEGDYYTDPSPLSSLYTWLYAVVDVRSSLPEDLTCEILYECFISPEYSITKDRTITWKDIVAESFRLTGLSKGKTPLSWSTPSGTLSVRGAAAGEKDAPLQGVRVVMSKFTLVSFAITDEKGSFSSDIPLPGNVRYRVDFTDGENSIGISESKALSSSHSLGWSGDEEGSFLIGPDSDERTIRRSAAALALKDYRGFVEREGLSSVNLPEGYSLRLVSGLDSEGMPLMSGRGVPVPPGLMKEYLPGGESTVTAYCADAVLGDKCGKNLKDAYEDAAFMISASGLYSLLGPSYWGRSITSGLQSGLYGGTSSSYGQSDDVIRMWSSFLAGILYEERFGRSAPRSSDDEAMLLFLPSIHEKGVSPEEILSAISWRTTTSDELMSALGGKK